MDDLAHGLLTYLTSHPGNSPDVGLALGVLTILWAWKRFDLGARLLRIRAKLPDWAQPLPPVVLSCAAVMLRAYLSGVRGWDLAREGWQEAFGTSAASVAIWHDGVKRLLPALWRLLLAAARKGREAGPAAPAAVLVAALTALASSQGCSVSLEQARARGVAARQAHRPSVARGDGVAAEAARGAAQDEAPPPGAPVADQAPVAAVTSPRCQSLDSRHRWGGTVAAGAAFLAGGAGLSTIQVDDEDRELRYGLAICAVGAAAVAAGAELYARDAATSWAEECQQ